MLLQFLAACLPPQSAQVAKKRFMLRCSLKKRLGCVPTFHAAESNGGAVMFKALKVATSSTRFANLVESQPLFCLDGFSELLGVEQLAHSRLAARIISSRRT